MAILEHTVNDPDITRGENLKIGDTVWVYDVNRRRYEGAGFNARIIFREHFRPCQIVGETSRSWIIDFGRKINKKRPEVFISESEVEKACWINENAQKIIGKLNAYSNRSYENLLAISNLLGLGIEGVENE